MILGEDGGALSKRHGAVSVFGNTVSKGTCPRRMLNYLVRLGWSHGDQEVFSVEEMIELFRCIGCQSSPHRRSILRS